MFTSDINEMADKMDFKTPAETAGEIIFERYVWLKPLIAVVESYIKRYNWNIMFIIEYYTHNFLFLRNKCIDTNLTITFTSLYQAIDT